MVTPLLPEAPFRDTEFIAAPLTSGHMIAISGRYHRQLLRDAGTVICGSARANRMDNLRRVR